MRRTCVVWFFASLTLAVFLLVASEIIETNGVSPECLGKNETPTLAMGSLSNSLKEHGINVCFPNGQGLSKASNVEFISLPPMHINDQVEPVDLQNGQMHGGAIDSKSFFEPTGCRESLGTNKKADSVPCSQIGICVQRNFFCPHWSVEAVEKGLEVSNVPISLTHICKQTCTDNMKLLLFLCNICLISLGLQIGNVLKAVFHVNAHNRLEVSNIYLLVILVFKFLFFRLCV